MTAVNTEGEVEGGETTAAVTAAAALDLVEQEGLEMLTAFSEKQETKSLILEREREI